MASGKKAKPKKASAPKRKSAPKGAKKQPAPRKKAPAKKAAAKKAAPKKPARKAAPKRPSMKKEAPAKAKVPTKAPVKKTPAKKPATGKTPKPKAAPAKKAPPKAESPKPAPEPEKNAPRLSPAPTAAVPVLKGPRQEPPAPGARPKAGSVDNQVFSAITYGLFAAINKTFGTFGQSVVKNASLRILEYGYKHGWLPPKAKDPVKALQEFFGRLESMGYAGSIRFTRKGDEVTCEIKDLAEWGAIADLRELHYPLLPLFTGELINAIVDQYFKQLVHVDSLDVVEENRGLTVKFSIHDRPQTVSPSRLPQISKIDEEQFE